MKGLKDIASTIVAPLMFRVASEGRKRPKDAGQGVRRAQRDMAAKRKANQAIPSGAVVTRQQRRAEARAQMKTRRASFKKAMMEQRLPGGSAVIR